MKNDGKRGIRRAWMERVRAKVRKDVEKRLAKEHVWSFNHGFRVGFKNDHMPFQYHYRRDVRNEGKPRPNWLTECGRCWSPRERCDCPVARDYRMLEAAAQEWKDWKNGVDPNEPLPDPFLKCEEDVATSDVSEGGEASPPQHGGVV